MTLRQARLPVRQIGSGGNERSRAGSVHRVKKVRRLAKGRFFGLTLDVRRYFSWAFEKVGRFPDRSSRLDEGRFISLTLQKFDARLAGQVGR